MIDGKSSASLALGDLVERRAVGEGAPLAMVIEDDVEFRLMANEPSGAEDLFVESIAIWLRDPTPYYVAFPSECAGDADDSAP